MKKVILLVAVLLSTSLVCGAKFLMPVRIQSTNHIFPDSFPIGQTLDQAIHNETVIEGDTIIVKGGTWNAHLNVNKSITLQGGYQGLTILDGGGNGTVVDISVGNVTLNYFTVRNGVYGIRIRAINMSVSNTVLENNSIVSNDNGIFISNSNNNVLRNNNLTGNYYQNFEVQGSALQDFIQDIDTSNTINDRPIYYWVNRTVGTIPSDAGYVAVVNSTNVTVENLNDNNFQGVLLAYATNSTVENNTLSSLLHNYGISLRFSKYNLVRNNTLTEKSGIGLSFEFSDNNTIVYNDVEKNGLGISLTNSFNNTAYRNNFVRNYLQEYHDASSVFDNGREGNYWDDYEKYGGSDTNGDGIGDTMTPYHGVYDHPLMEPWKMIRTFGIVRYGDKYNFTTLSNSTIASPNWNRTRAIIGFNITSGTSESINITIPRNWLEGPFEIRLNASHSEPSTPVNQDCTNSYICLDYSPGTYMVEIIGKLVSGYRSGDINGNGTVDIYDAIILANHFNKSDP